MKHGVRQKGLIHSLYLTDNRLGHCLRQKAGSKPAKDARPVLSMVSQSCKTPEVPAEAVLSMRLAPWWPAPSVSYDISPASVTLLLTESLWANRGSTDCQYCPVMSL